MLKIGMKLKERITPEIEKKMAEIEAECLEYLRDTYKQARW